MSPTAELLLVFALIAINGLFVLSEMAIVSARKVRLQQLANQGDRKAGLALELSQTPGRFLPTVQVGITLMAILSGARGESAISRQILPLLKTLNLGEYTEPIAAVLAIIIITYLTIVLGELVPKRLALNNPEKIASLVSIPMNLLARFSSPITTILSWSTETVMKVLGIKPSEEPEVTEEEIKVLIEQGTEAGMFEESEQDMLERILGLGDRKIGTLMTPRPDIVWLDLEDSIDVNLDKILNSGYSRFPVCQGELDRVVGLIHVADLLSETLDGKSLDLTSSNIKNVFIQPLFVPETTKGLKVLEQFKISRTHIAMVVDEYGVIQGLVTMNDLLEAIVGDIPDIEQPEDPQIIEREDGSWLVDGMLPIEEFLKKFDIPDTAIEQRGTYHTLGGFTIMQLGKIPTESDNFEWRRLKFEVMDMDGNRVDKLLVQTVEEEEIEEED
jgi:putative hemolysin